MSIFDYRQTEPVYCAGLPITTFLSDDRRFVLVSATDLTEQLSLAVNLDEYDLEKYTVHRNDGKLEAHECITADRINDFLYSHDCTNESHYDNLNEFRSCFHHEVMKFWERFQYAAASLSVRDAVKVLDKEANDLADSYDIVPGRIYEISTQYIGYNSVPNKDNLSTIEYATTSYIAVLYSYIAASMQDQGASTGKSMKLTDRRIKGLVEAIGDVLREL